ncbi:chromate efflux transporter [Abyssalbus ytuae]|uniref:Chromate efflux transporter n=1 Tax=Abyssalbus ytuae TaxID=2926907 RepID=A0A9E7D0I2_9FLAO|nr:chromate efflux transporter [Abyssalbus ytuae]UOB16043.1 chromate efflux transporter [Abyssalbus ytuae]
MRRINRKTEDTKTEVHQIKLMVLFLSFLKIGTISWGGFMSLISVVQKELIQKKGILKDKDVLDGISMASILPGPVAVNVIVYIGYQLRGIKGAAVSMLGILLPSFIFMMILSYIYLEYAQLPVLANFFKGVLPAITAIIFLVAFGMAKKHIKDYKQVIICVLAIVALILMKSVFTTFIIILGGAFFGYVFYNKSKEMPNTNTAQSNKNSGNKRQLIYVLSGVVGFSALLWFLPFILPDSMAPLAQIEKDLFITFSSISVTLFGGGYVIIPIMQDIIVSELGWLSIKEFTDAIAMGQLTPGPIFISATFIGYKVGGILGAITATLAIFVPPGLMMLFFSEFFNKIRHSKFVIAAFKGLHPAVIGMIFAAVFTIGKSIPFSWFSVCVFIAILIASLKYKIDVVYLIPLSGISGVLFFNFF